jgi:ABC-type bacteriocin/lantibiotic exporter with double-glycine peptidase domain
VRRQTSDNDCGPTAIANALEFHHKRIGLRGLRTLCGTTDDGSDEHDIMRALLAYGCGVDEYRGDDARNAWAWLLESLNADRPVLLCLDRWSHWTTAIGAGRQVVVYDPSREHGGSLVLRFRDLRPRWEAARRVRRAGGAPGVRFYGIAVGPPTLW